MSVIYEVTATVGEGLYDAFERYMSNIHIPDVMATRAFENATFAKLVTGQYRTSYVAASRDDLAIYFAEHAPRLREHVANEFPEGVEFARQEWTTLATF